MQKLILIALVAVPSLSCGAAGKKELQARLESLEVRVAELEESRARPRRYAPPVKRDPSRYPFDVTLAKGAVEFHGTDGIEITGVRGDRATLEVGGTYQVKGRYTLDTRQNGILLLSVTAKAAPDGRGAPNAESVLRISKGSGDFTLTKKLTYEGFPHVTMHSADSGKPFAGVYFGHDAWLLREKSWRYEGQAGEPAMGNDVVSPTP